MKTRNKVLSLAAVLALGLGGFGGTFALWTAEKSATPQSAVMASGYLKFDESAATVSVKWIDLTAVAADNLYELATGNSKVELDNPPVFVPGGVYGKIITVTPKLQGQNLVAKLTAVGGALTGVEGETNPFTLEVAKIWTDENNVVDGDSFIEFVESSDKITLPGNDGAARIASDTPFNVLVVAKMDGQAEANMEEAALALPNVTITATQVSPADLVATD